MSKKCRAYSESRLGLEPSDNRKAFYAGWDAALREALAQSRSDVEQPAFVLDAYRIETEFFGLDDNAQDHPKAEALYRLAKQPAQQEPVAWMKDCADFWEHYTYISEASQENYKAEAQMWVEKLRTSPPASKPWVSLTDEERDEIEEIAPTVGDAISMTQWKLREKNA